MRVRFFRLAPGEAPIEVSARTPGDRIAARFEALEPGARYTVHVTTQFRGGLFASALEAPADGDGILDTAVAADPDGLFWSMKRTGSAPDEPAAPPGFTFRLEQEGSSLLQATLASERLRPGVRALPLDDRDGLVGTLFLPASPGPQPAIITLGGSDGRLDAAALAAAALANQGFAALAVAYFGAPGLPPALVDIPLEYFERALRFLQSHPAIQADRLGVIGRSRGGELALLLGATFPEIRAVVAQVPSPYRWCGSRGAPSAAWVHRGVRLPYLAGTGATETERAADGRVLHSLAAGFVSALEDAGEEGRQAALIDIASTRGPILLLSADDDQVWPSARLAEAAMKRLSGRGTADEWISYPAAGHNATALPGDPTTEGAVFHPVMGAWLELGGTPEGNARAQRDAWGRVITFFHRHIPPRP
jgi:dienelactone hydrolase